MTHESPIFMKCEDTETSTTYGDHWHLYLPNHGDSPPIFSKEAAKISLWAVRKQGVISEPDYERIKAEIDQCPLPPHITPIDREVARAHLERVRQKYQAAHLTPEPTYSVSFLGTNEFRYREVALFANEKRITSAYARDEYDVFALVTAWARIYGIPPATKRTLRAEAVQSMLSILQGTR